MSGTSSWPRPTQVCPEVYTTPRDTNWASLREMFCRVFFPGKKLGNRMLIIEIEAAFSYCQLFSLFPVEQTENEFYWDKWRWNRRVVESGYMPANIRDDHHCWTILMGSVLRAKELQEALQDCRQGWERLLRPVPRITRITCLLVCVVRPKRWCLRYLLLVDEHETFFTILTKGKGPSLVAPW